MGFGSVIAGYLIKRTGYFKWLLSLCCLGPVVAMVLLSQLNERSSDAALWLGVPRCSAMVASTDPSQTCCQWALASPVSSPQR